MFGIVSGEGTRAHDTRIAIPLLYRLNYAALEGTTPIQQETDRVKIAPLSPVKQSPAKKGKRLICFKGLICALATGGCIA